MNSKLKTILIIVGVIVLIGAVIYFVSSKSSPTESRGLVTNGTAATAVTPSATPGSTIGREFVSMLLNLREITLDNSLFNDPAFISLNDYTITLVQPGGEGRANPFAPFTTTVVPSLNIQNGPSAFEDTGGDNLPEDEDL